MSYWQHWKANMTVACRGLLLVFFHTLHAFIPIKQTSHNYWGINLYKPKLETITTDDIRSGKWRVRGDITRYVKDLQERYP